MRNLQRERAKRAVAKIGKLIEQMEQVCDQFDYTDVQEDETVDWVHASLYAFYRGHVESGIEGLREIQAYYESKI